MPASPGTSIGQHDHDAGAIDVVVVGVANVDLVTRVPALPLEGQTVFGSPLATRAGGKGLNQAIAVARCGGRAALSAQAGDDPWGRLLRDSLVAAGVDTSAFTLVPGGSTAAVLIQVPESGDSAATVTRTSTTLHTLEDIEKSTDLMRRASATVVQLELESDVIAAALAAAHGIKIGMLAPLQPISASLLHTFDLIVVNAVEAAAILGQHLPDSASDRLELARHLVNYGLRAAVVTLGADGAALATHNAFAVEPVHRATVWETTGAGDAFLGALALTLARGGQLIDGVRAGTQAGAEVVTAHR